VVVLAISLNLHRTTHKEKAGFAVIYKWIGSFISIQHTASFVDSSFFSNINIDIQLIVHSLHFFLSSGDADAIELPVAQASSVPSRAERLECWASRRF